MSERILFAGASGALGMEILKLFKGKEGSHRAMVHSEEGRKNISSLIHDIWKVNAESSYMLRDITKNISTVISTMGKSVSLFSNEAHSFMQNDYVTNKNLLEDAVKNKVRRFIYVSIKGADSDGGFEIAEAHKKFEAALEKSGIEYTIIRPVGFFSGLNDLAIMAKRNIIPIVGEGQAKTNSIHQKDLAEVVVGYLQSGPEIIEVGGPLVHTRLEMAEMIRDKIGGKIIKIPEKAADLSMFLPGIFSNNIAPKLKYFNYITTRDMIGEKRGNITFSNYLENLDLNKLP